MSARGTRQDWGSFLCTPRRKAGAQERHKTRLEQNLLNRAKQLRVLWVSQGMTKVAAKKKKKTDLGKKGYMAHYVHPPSPVCIPYFCTLRQSFPCWQTFSEDDALFSGDGLLERTGP